MRIRFGAIAHAQLVGVTTGQHHAQLHAAAHDVAAGDDLSGLYLPLATGGDVAGNIVLNNNIRLQGRDGVGGVVTLAAMLGLVVTLGDANRAVAMRSSGTFTHHNGVTTVAIARMTTGVYTGDGELSQAIAGVGFRPKYVKIWTRSTIAAHIYIYETTDTIVDDSANGMAAEHDIGANPHSLEENKIIALGADGFTVDDGGADLDPNTNGVVYNYMALG